ncbi:hypothetical protein G5V57_09940 [Nordella sp. HKS 07]|uniref:hypothetical protein n=1 Tax=Nordella sp. HKS 07 TaxID=2712222 RepID=UPI0013E1CE06|nr:hypothetical protein [Nordella sp. HKS 07]QIG48013.1 hypothetical protein G5V57_09940 [Nordella sp. HKS 07]
MAMIAAAMAPRLRDQKEGCFLGGGGGGAAGSSVCFCGSVSPVSEGGEMSSASRSMTGLLAFEPCDSFSMLLFIGTHSSRGCTRHAIPITRANPAKVEDFGDEDLLQHIDLARILIGEVNSLRRDAR